MVLIECIVPTVTDSRVTISVSQRHYKKMRDFISPPPPHVRIADGPPPYLLLTEKHLGLSKFETINLAVKHLAVHEGLLKNPGEVVEE